MSKRVPTILAPALPALILLAITTAGMVDPPRAGLATQLHLTSVSIPGTSSGLASLNTPIALQVTAR